MLYVSGYISRVSIIHEGDKLVLSEEIEEAEIKEEVVEEAEEVEEERAELLIDQLKLFLDITKLWRKVLRSEAPLEELITRGVARVAKEIPEKKAVVRKKKPKKTVKKKEKKTKAKTKKKSKKKGSK